jgi:hypothetical protein
VFSNSASYELISETVLDLAHFGRRRAHEGPAPRPIYVFSLPVHLHIRRFILKGLASSTGGLVRGYSVCPPVGPAIEYQVARSTEHMNTVSKTTKGIVAGVPLLQTSFDPLKLILKT